MKKNEGTLKTCSRGHTFYKSSDCPVCPKCWAGASKKAQNDFPKIGAPALRALKSAKITKLSQLSRYTEADIANLHGVGPSALRQLRTAMKKEHLSFKKA